MKKLYTLLLMLGMALPAAAQETTPPVTPVPVTAAAAPDAPAAGPTSEQRLAALEAYIQNTDPTAALAGDGAAVPPVGVSGPGHNGFKWSAPRWCFS